MLSSLRSVIPTPQGSVCRKSPLASLFFGLAVGGRIGPSPSIHPFAASRPLQRTGPAWATFQSSASLSIIPNEDAEGFPSWWRTSPLPDLLDTPSQVCLPQHDTLLPPSHFFHEWECLPGVLLWVLRTVRSATHFSLGEIPPASTGFS